ncbi:hypothetical protein VTK73DRAFT_606 [Phialemonium thermophilum]|uniref:VWFA domain-containing protein n=1 Tax=Phialemonium thermophilum TaxID=223376 RepID=A0ABR3XDG4_9PEZI
MPLEAVMVVVDNSESSRNGDYPPSRYDAQADAVSIIFQNVVQGNPESSVGLMSMGGKGPEVLVTLTTDQGKILEGLHRTKQKIRGSAHLATGIQIAGLALKHRQNKSQRQRIVVFVCSPVQESEAELVKLAKKMKKYTISVDFILFGEVDDQETDKKLRAFNEAVKGSEGSHYVVIPPSGQLLSDQLLSTPILFGEGGAGPGAAATGLGGGNIDGNEFDFDPSQDPELALALRMSMEEERARQERKAREEAEAAKKNSLETVQEEDGESQPLLGKDGEPSGSNAKAEEETEGDKDKPDDRDKMDTS